MAFEKTGRIGLGDNAQPEEEQPVPPVGDDEQEEE